MNLRVRTGMESKLGCAKSSEVVKDLERTISFSSVREKRRKPFGQLLI